MGWLDDLWGAGGDTAIGTDSVWGGGWDWGSLLGGGDDSWLSGNVSVGGGNSGGGGSGGGLFGGGDSGGGTGSNLWGDLMKGILGGIGASADAKQNAKFSTGQIRVGGEENRKTVSFAKDLEDFYKKRDSRDKRVALDSYGQFSRLREWKPDYVAPAVPTVPTRPTP